jgi:HK97 family phage prohead protease
MAYKEPRPFEIKELGSAGEFAGYLSVFDEIDSYNDTIKPGAYKKTLRERKKFPILWQHDYTVPIGSFTGSEDEKGLLINGSLNLDVKQGQEARSLIMRGDVDGLSIGFDAVKWAIEERDKVNVRVLKEIRLWEGSIVTFPADQHARIMQAKAASILRRPEELTDEDLHEWLRCLPDEQRSRIESLLRSEPELSSTRDSEQPSDFAALSAMLRDFEERLRA